MSEMVTVPDVTSADIDQLLGMLMDPADVATSTITTDSQMPNNAFSVPYVEIVEQPASRNLRFRYECEGRSAGSIVGANSTPELKTYTTIKVHNYKGPFIVIASAVTKDGPLHKPHPHNLVGKEGCKKGIFSLLVSNPDMTYSFTSLGIQCVKRRDIEKYLTYRSECRVDPYGTGFQHMSQPGSIDLNVVRLCFQVFVAGPDEKCTVPLQPVVSDPIYDKKAMSDLTIVKLSHYAAPVCGNTEVILLCDRVTKEDIQVWFFEERNSMVTWQDQAEFQASDVHKQVAISFRTPRYQNENIQQPISVFVQLRRPSDNLKGDARPFQFLPMERDPEGLARKRLKMANSCYRPYFEGAALPGSQAPHERVPPIAVPRLIRHPVRQHLVKQEPSPAGPSDTFPGVVMLPMLPQYPTIPPVAAIPTTELVQNVHLTPAHSPSVAVSPGACSYASSVSPPSAVGMQPIMPSASFAPSSLSPAQSPLDEILERSSPLQGATSILDESVIKGFNSLEIVLDSKELFIPNSMTFNLSSGMFASIDSANNLMENTLQDAAQVNDQTMTAEDSLNHNSIMQNQLSKYC